MIAKAAVATVVVRQEKINDNRNQKIGMQFKFRLLIMVCLSVQAGYAQIENTTRTSWYTPNGSARNQATGGVMGSLGGDITANNINPAGIGLFKTGEFVFTPNFWINQNRFNYRDSGSQLQKSNMGVGAIGFIFGSGRRYRHQKWTSTAFSISFNQLANYNNRIQFKGTNNFSSFSEQFLEELVKDRADTNAALSNYIFGSSLAFRTYLIDTANNGSGVFNGYKSLVPISTGILQEYDEKTTGSFNEISFAFAGNLEDRLYVGASINLPYLIHQQNRTIRETDQSGNLNNNFAFSQFDVNERTTAIGINAKLGFIYKPKDFIRVGFALHTPSIMGFRDQIRASMETDTENYAGKLKETSDALNSGDAGTREYTLITPFRAIASASYVFREVENTKQQRAFVSADVEYVNYRGARFKAADPQDIGDVNYYNAVNEAVKEAYKSNINFKLGGELKFHTWMVRLGGAYFGSPYADENIKANRVILSTGLGYRNKGIFLDLTYAHQINKDAVFAYRLADKPNTFAQWNANRGNIVASIGCKF